MYLLCVNYRIYMGGYMVNSLPQNLCKDFFHLILRAGFIENSTTLRRWTSGLVCKVWPLSQQHPGAWQKCRLWGPSQTCGPESAFQHDRPPNDAGECVGSIGSDYWLSHLSVYQRDCYLLLPEFLVQRIYISTGFQVMLLLLVQGPYFEKHQIKASFPLQLPVLSFNSSLLQIT